MMKLRIMGEFIARGCQVFPSMNSSAGCDLVILLPHNHQFIRIMIRAGNQNPASHKIYFNRPAEGSYDLCAVVLPNETVYYPAPHLKLERRNRALPPVELPALP
jgi:hypothetical protein